MGGRMGRGMGGWVDGLGLFFFDGRRNGFKSWFH